MKNPYSNLIIQIMILNCLFTLRYINLIVFLLCFSSTSFAQKENTLQSYEILSIDRNGKPTSIDFVSTKVEISKLDGFLKSVYGFDKNSNFITYLEKPFLKNGSFIRKQYQYYKGYKVEFGEVTITHKDNLLLSLGANIISIKDYEPIVSISEGKALEITLQDMGAVEYAWQNEFEQNSLRKRTKSPNATYYPTGELVIVDKSNFDNSNSTHFVLAYIFTIQSSQPFAIKRYYVNATTSKILHKGSGLYFIKVMTQQGQLFTLRYVKR